MRPVFHFTAAALGGLAALVVATSVFAENGPPITDTRTGRTWTPDIIPLNDPRSGPMDPAVDKAFNPHNQIAMVPGTVIQRPRANLMGVVPITAGPTVPLITLDAPSLQAIPGAHWLAILYLTNNSANTVDAVVDCHFTNQGAKVEDVRLLVPPAGPGERLGVPVRGPRTDLFVNQVVCQLMSPI
jgi:hypothetical protein